MPEPFTHREIKALAQEVHALRAEITEHKDSINEYIKQDGVAHTAMIGRMDSLRTEVKENTNFRKRIMNAIVGTAFLALASLGVAVLKVTGVLNLFK